MLVFPSGETEFSPRYKSKNALVNAGLLTSPTYKADSRDVARWWFVSAEELMCQVATASQVSPTRDIPTRTGKDTRAAYISSVNASRKAPRFGICKS
jgi:hypothetical protein